MHLQMAALSPSQPSKCDVCCSFIASQRELLFPAQKLLSVDAISYKFFFQNNLIPNQPCLFSTKLTEEWPSRKEWTRDGVPNFEILKEKFGSAVVPVADCKQEQYSSHPKQDMKFSQYLEYWQEYRANGYPEAEPCLYLKDWHFTRAFPDYKAYHTPVYFQSDWLNEFWDTLAGEDDYRFVYMGPKGTWTPFHADVYRSYSWSANICGRKLWIFFPPGQENCFKDRFGNLAYDITSSELEDQVRYPNYRKDKDHRLEIIQEQGQIIFVPSGWHHQVYNMEDTISINHNWLNGCNIDICWNHLRENLESVKKEIADCKDMEGWHQQCQLILKASAGIDYKMFCDLIRTITEKRIERLKKMKQKLTEDSEICHTCRKERGNVNDTNSLKTPAVFTDIRKENQKEEVLSETTKAKEPDMAGNDNNCSGCGKMASACGSGSKTSSRIVGANSSSDNRVRDLESHMNQTNINSRTYDHEPVNKDVAESNYSDVNKGTIKKEFQTEGICETDIKAELPSYANSSSKETYKQASFDLWPQHPLDRDHTVFDLYRLESILKDVLSDPDFKTISAKDELISVASLLDQIHEVLSESECVHLQEEN